LNWAKNNYGKSTNGKIDNEMFKKVFGFISPHITGIVLRTYKEQKGIIISAEDSLKLFWDEIIQKNEENDKT
jgi:hypothetical protein